MPNFIKIDKIIFASGFHTIISHGDCKDVLCPPHTWDDEGNIVYGGSNQILTYFDISSAEVLIGRL